VEYRDEVYFESRPEPEPPFPRQEFDRRVAAVRARMAACGIDTLWLTAPESMYYVSGYQCEWYQAQSPRQWPASSGIAIRVDDDRVVAFDTERESVLGRVFATVSETRFFPRSSLRDGAVFTVDELDAAGWLRGTVGLELWSYRPNRPLSERFQALVEARGGRVVDGTDIVRDVRWVKSPAEWQCLEQAARIADCGIAAARAVIAPGVTELEVYGEIVRAMSAAGGENPAITMPVLSGSKTNAAHALATRRRMQPGEIVTIDVCGVVKRYHANAARTFVLGEPAADVREAARLAAGSIDVVRSLLRPALAARDLGDTLVRYYRDCGLWSSRGWIGGYEMGIAFPPDWVGNVVWDAQEANDLVFAPGTAVNCETQVFLPGHAGLFFGIDTLLFGATDAQVASGEDAGLCVIDM
jgi:Xaa-Pro dipeptidase